MTAVVEVTPGEFIPRSPAIGGEGDPTQIETLLNIQLKALGLPFRARPGALSSEFMELVYGTLLFLCEQELQRRGHQQ